MSWFYVSGGSRLGPVSDQEFDALISGGTINSSTLVWRQGMPEWQAYGILNRSAFAGAGSTAADIVACGECGRYFRQSETVSIHGSSVCASCKPMALQKLKEGVALTSEMDYGGFWIRFAAKFIDGLLVYIVNFALSMGFMAVIRTAGNDDMVAVIAAIALMILQLAVQGAYYIYLHGRYGATLGKMAVGLRVVRSDGSNLTYGRATGRFFAEMLSGFMLLIGYVIAAFDDEKRSLHDHICDMRVIYSKR